MDSGLGETELQGVPVPDVDVSVVVGSSGVWLMMSQGIRRDEAEVRSHIYYHHPVTCVCCLVRVAGCGCGPHGDGDGSGDPTDPVHQLIHCGSHNSEIGRHSDSCKTKLNIQLFIILWTILKVLSAARPEFIHATNQGQLHLVYATLRGNSPVYVCLNLPLARVYQKQAENRI